MVRDTQKCKALREKAKNKHPGLKKLCALELGLEIQKGSHSSVQYAPSPEGDADRGRRLRMRERRWRCTGCIRWSGSSRSGRVRMLGRRRTGRGGRRVHRKQQTQGNESAMRISTIWAKRWRTLMRVLESEQSTFLEEVGKGLVVD
jgi:hypothetical protein